MLALSLCSAPALAEQSEAAAGSAVMRSDRGASRQTDHPRLFGTVEFRLSLKKQKNWLDVLRRHADAPVFQDGKKLNRSTTWKELKGRAQGKPLFEMLDVVNRFWNGWPYRADAEVWGQEDYWAAPAEFLSRSGDCEDYCIAKGVPYLRIDTDYPNLRMQHILEKNGFVYCGTVLFEGAPKLAYDKPLRRETEPSGTTQD